jgi:AraC-like DNA-binding protein
MMSQSLPPGENSETRRLVQAAEDAATSIDDDAVSSSRRLEELSSLYRQWVVHNYSTFYDHRDVEKYSLLVYALASASTLEESLFLAEKIKNHLYDAGSAVALKDGDLVFTFRQQGGETIQGFLMNLWPLALTLCEAEFLVGQRLDGVKGSVPTRCGLPQGVVAALFNRPLAFDAPTLSLTIPRRHLKRPVVARAADVPRFLEDLFPIALGLTQQTGQVKSLVAGLVREDRLRQPGANTTVRQISAKLGCSAATLRRRLKAEGTTFREVKEESLDTLAKHWLRDRSLTLDGIAEQLGFSDAFAFRRAFKRRNGVSPSDFRRRQTD